MDADERTPLGQLLVDRLENAGDQQAILVAAAQVHFERRTTALVRGHDVEDVAVRVDRALGIVEVLLLDLTEAELELGVRELVVVGANDRELAANDVRELLPLRVAEVDAVEATQRDRLVAGGVEDALIGGDCLLVVLDLVLVELTDLGLDRDPLIAVVRELELLGVDAEQLLELIGSRLPDYIQARRFPPSRLELVRSAGTRIA